MIHAKPVESSSFSGIAAPEKVWLELHREGDACDVIVCMEDGAVFTASFATLDYIHRQMNLTFQLTSQMPDVPAVAYAPLDTPHLIVPSLDLDVIEDVIDNLIALDVFESHFTRVTEDNSPARTTNDGKLATQEVAAVVIQNVLFVER